MSWESFSCSLWEEFYNVKSKLHHNLGPAVHLSFDVSSNDCRFNIHLDREILKCLRKTVKFNYNCVYKYFRFQITIRLLVQMQVLMCKFSK